ncbi:MAG: FAD-binding protein [Nitrospirota bacterium]|nr:FAD-binding protein [Nitrospirota bacterium]MDH5585494.1 FAD-binding protein [Nitrospirota bacterium]MDH5773439.1 FAD-binding protein [Nitrospirota bacterium]
MQKKLQLQVSPRTASNSPLLAEAIRAHLSLKKDSPLQYKILKRSIDARSRTIRINLGVLVVIDEELPIDQFAFDYQDVSSSKKTCHIIGAGPGGLFAALRCLERGIKPIVIERGKDVRARRRDLAAIHKEHRVNPESNYCFGEGGAGTYSDGKLYTRSNKRGDIDKILKTLVAHGASPDIMVDAHPHIGTNKLPQLIQRIRETILQHGGEILFNTKLIDLGIRDQMIVSIVIEHKTGAEEVPITHLILATGHSARDIYELLNTKHILLEAKPFALGVRAEHPQELIDHIQYHCRTSKEVQSAREYLPAASYSLVQQLEGRGVYSFCMCPGGIIAPCATAQQEVVVNGWSPSKRNNPFANSGIVVGLELKDFQPYKAHGPLAGLEFQKTLEKQAWILGGHTQAAPAQRLTDFMTGKLSSSLPACSYQPGLRSIDMRQVLGPIISEALHGGFQSFGGKMRGYLSQDAIIVGVESRTSTPVRIPRDKDHLHHPQLVNLFPCGEGAGYAGGIMSAAMDGERCANSMTY